LIARVAALNELIRKLNTMGTNVIASQLAPLDATVVVEEWQTNAPDGVA
jgi:hypothetical protein